MTRSFLRIFIILLYFCGTLQGQWQKISPTSIFSNSVNGAAFGSGHGIMVGLQGLIALRSGNEWKELPPLTKSHLHAVANTGSHFVAVGDKGTIIAASNNNPSHWFTISSPVTEDLYSIQLLNDAWYIRANAGCILKSTDGLTWNILKEGNTDPRFSSLTHFENEFLGIDNGILYRSFDGITWSESDNQIPLYGVEGLKRLGNRLVAWGLFGHQGIATRNENESEWSILPSPLLSSLSDIGEIFYENGRYFLSGTNTYWSDDLLTWTQMQGNVNSRVWWDEVLYYKTYNNSYETSSDGIHWITENGHLTFPLVYSHDHFYGVQENLLFSSGNGITWSESLLPQGISGYGIFEANGVHMVSKAGKFAITTDFQTWTTGIPPAGKFGDTFVYAFGKYYAVWQSLGNRIYSSSDALHWQQFSTGLTMAFGNGRLVMLNNSAQNIQISTNGTSATGHFVDLPNAQSIAFGNGLFVIASSKMGEEIKTSTDGLNWIRRDTPITNSFSQIRSIIFTNNRFFARGLNTTLTSTDGIHWEDISHIGRDHPPTPYSVSYGNGTWIFTGATPLRSEDLSNFQSLKDNLDQNFVRIRYLNGAFWALSHRTNHYVSGSVWRSTDGTNWRWIKSFDLFPSDIAISSDNRVLITFEGQSAAYSDDLINWHHVESAGAPKVVFHNGAFYGSAGYSVRRSEDGATWATVSELPSFYLEAFCSTPLGLFAVGSGNWNNRIYRSLDGLTWTAVHSSNSPDLYAISYASGKLWAGGANGHFITSPDGINWSVVPRDAQDLRSYYTNTILDLVPTGHGFLMRHRESLYLSNYSQPGIAAEQRTPGIISSIAYGNGISIAVGNNNTIYRKASASTPPSSTEVMVTKIGDRYIELSWTDSNTPAGFIFQYRLKGTDLWFDVGGLQSDQRSIIVSNLQPNSTYEFKVTNSYAGEDSIPRLLASGLPTTISPIKEWRRNQFGSMGNNGTGADEFDSDSDGIPNLIEYAFGTEPLVSNAVPISYFTTASSTNPDQSDHHLEFPLHSLRSDIDYIVEYSENLTTWSKLATSIGGKPLNYYPMQDSHQFAGNNEPLRKITLSLSGARKKNFYRVRVVSREQ